MSRAWLALALGALLAGCATPNERTTEIATINATAGYRYGALEAAAPKTLNDTFVVATFSGGGTRAAALAYGALKALEATHIPAGGRDTVMADEIDMISSVSGGSVTAALYGLRGRAGMEAFKTGFLKHDVMGELIGTALNPVTWARLATPAYARIDALRDYFDENVFAGATYAGMIEGSQAGAGRRPYVVLNAADMSTGAVFSFTQDQFDLICADLTRLHVADAVAASAAFPVALTALTLKNHSPCPAQAEAARNFRTTNWRLDGDHPRPLRVTNDLGSQSLNPARYRHGDVARRYLNEDGAHRYVQLLDGGIADNLGLTEPVTMMTSPDRSPSIRARINRGQIKRVVLIVVNARSEPDTTYAQSAKPPGALSTLLTTIGTPIDATSFLMLDHLGTLLSEETETTVDPIVVQVDFDFIADDACRRQFKNLATSWALPDSAIDGLTMLGEAMVLEAARYRDFVAALRGRVDSQATVAKACALVAQK